MSESVVVIVDFDNFFPGQLQNYTIQELESFFTKIINLITNCRKSALCGWDMKAETLREKEVNGRAEGAKASSPS